ncbi:hypothetical protein [Corallococcus sp. 4LFB]|uniref:hypothetical protein n=1 Tax=Corallococcus sp. 4LFB TaxID=3383249 RepID=UPI003974D64D
MRATSLRRLAPGAHLKLSAFGAAEVALLAESMAGVLPPEAVELVTRLAEGNPFMASAVLHGLVEDGVLMPGPDGWLVQPEAMAHARSSRQAATFLVRRLRLLPPESLHVLSVGAVLGKSFDTRAVAACPARRWRPSPPRWSRRAAGTCCGRRARAPPSCTTSCARCCWTCSPRRSAGSCTGWPRGPRSRPRPTTPSSWPTTSTRRGRARRPCPTRWWPRSRRASASPWTPRR